MMLLWFIFSVAIFGKRGVTIAGIPITITEEIVARAARCPKNEGKFQWNLNKKTSYWVKIVNDVLHKDRPSNKLCDILDECRVLQKLVFECFLPRAGGSDSMSLDHSVFLYFLINHEKVNLEGEKNTRRGGWIVFYLISFSLKNSEH